MSILDAIGLRGIPFVGRPDIPEGEFVVMSGGLVGRRGKEVYFHQRLSTKHKWRKKHGRPRNAPRLRRTTVSTYQPDYDFLIASINDGKVHRA